MKRFGISTLLTVVLLSTLIDVIHFQPTYAALSQISSTDSKVKAYYYGSWLVSCWGQGSYSVDMVNNSGTDVSSGNIGSGNTFATGLTGSDSRQCNDAKFSKAAIAAVGLPWTTPDVLNFLCNTVGATRQGNCTDITNPEKFAVNLSGKTGVAVKNLLIKTAGYNFFADYASNKLLQYEYWQATALANTFDGSTVCGTDSSTPLTIAGDGVMSISLLQKNGTTKTFMYKYDPNAVLGFWDGFNGTNTQHNCSYAVSKVNQLAAEPCRSATLQKVCGRWLYNPDTAEWSIAFRRFKHRHHYLCHRRHWLDRLPGYEVRGNGQ